MLFSCVGPTDCSMPGLPDPHLGFAQTHDMFTESGMPCNLLVLCRPLLLHSIFPSIRVFPNESALCIRWPEYWSFSISPCSEYSGLISFRIDWFDLLAVQGTLKSLSSVLSLLYGLAFKYVHNYWKNQMLC